MEDTRKKEDIRKKEIDGYYKILHAGKAMVRALERDEWVTNRACRCYPLEFTDLLTTAKALVESTNTTIEEFKRPPLKKLSQKELEKLTPAELAERRPAKLITWVGLSYTEQDIIELAGLFEKHYGQPPGISNEGPFVRFVRATFRSLFRKRPSGETIKAAIRKR